MGRPLGSKNRSKEFEQETVVVPHETVGLPDVRPDLVLTIRRLHVGSFSGLWELCRVESDGTIKVITDANTKQIVMNLARNEISRCGQ